MGSSPWSMYLTTCLTVEKAEARHMARAMAGEPARSSAFSGCASIRLSAPLLPLSGVSCLNSHRYRSSRRGSAGREPGMSGASDM